MKCLTCSGEMKPKIEDKVYECQQCGGFMSLCHDAVTGAPIRVWMSKSTYEETKKRHR